ncbi:copper chaperone PCu(A)C [Sphaerotilus sp.]|uniref:copper chaperone PCu(A)C n=1 Tax=Sphaerotilus sp. TaxID=2093942 RepID=UPI002ACD7ED7|nr:copper chaperone PCu(A)C [Sphaerotilus sp.]MDZ7855631.1 copper chaperone PCu(A)C [Sphaerotilus sp.]
MKFSRSILTTTAFAALTLASVTAAHAQVTVKEPWVRGTVASQKATGAFMQLTTTEAVRLVEARSGAAKIVEIHEMRMEGDRMMMQAVPGLDIVPGKTLELKPGGYHVMLIDVVKPLNAGDKVPLTLVLEGKDKKRIQVDVSAEVRALNARPAMQQHQH